VTPLLLLATLLSQLLPAPKHLALTASVDPPAAARGSKVSLHVDVVPNPGIHVYAPGAKEYQPIAVSMDPHAGVTFGAVKYPKAEVLEFAGEKIPVYQQPFRLIEDVTLAPSLAAASVTLTGTVKYQACDDRVCFIPASVPVRVTVNLR
jgi:thiol:disulfide interchange protein DsbD